VQQALARQQQQPALPAAAARRLATIVCLVARLGAAGVLLLWLLLRGLQQGM
jgi:hypothetical protein